jgi:hypothetical protein
MAENFLQTCRDFEARLTALGYGDWATRIEDAISTTSTGTELWMTLRLRLQQLEASDCVLPEELREKLRAMIAETNRVLAT